MKTKSTCILSLLSAVFITTAGCTEKDAQEKTTAVIDQPAIKQAIVPHDPKNPPKKLPDVFKVAKSTKNYLISGIGYSAKNKVAIINKHVFREGEEIDPGVYVQNIYPTYVSIMSNSQQIQIRPEAIQSKMTK